MIAPRQSVRRPNRDAPVIGRASPGLPAAGGDSRATRLLLAGLLTAIACAPRARTVSAPLPASNAPFTRAMLRAALDSVAAAPEFRNANWGILIVDPVAPETLYSRNAGKLFMPASNMKIATGATALALLGPDYRYRTTVVARGPVRGGMLDGDLVIIGRGDPTVSDHMRGDAMQPLRDLADSVAARGVTKIRGRVVAAGDAFPDTPLGFGWAWDDLDFPYSAGVDELLFNEGFSRLIVRAGERVGETPTVTTAPARTYPRVRVSAVTVAPPPPTPPETPVDSTRPQPTLTFAADTVRGSVVVSGEIIAADTAVLEVAHRDPTGAYLAAFVEALRERGVGVDSAAEAQGDGVRTDDTLVVMISPPLSEILPALEKPSQNQIAEVLLKTLGLERGGAGTADSGRRVIERQLIEWGADSAGFAVRDGSGLSRHNYLAPETVVRVLDAMRRHPSFTVFYEALPVAGVDGTIRGRMKGTPAERNVHAKTGTLDKARALSGYVTTGDGRQLIFSFLANNYTVRTRDVDRAVDGILARLAGSTLGR
jgi:D-alanyl-D-alanine carboxypeptidase/D-alanyl-D-alanine-endopeptidase (penicillin-binding protein 4)